MKFNKFGVLAALAAGTVFTGCSSNQPAGQDENTSSVKLNLTTSEGVVITAVHYDLDKGNPLANYTDGDIDVPNPDSTISLGIESLPGGTGTAYDYSLALSAVGTYHGATYNCTSPATPFHLNANEAHSPLAIVLKCIVNDAVVDTSGSVAVDVSVDVDQVSVGTTVETFTYGPRSVKGVDADGNGPGIACNYPPIKFKVQNNDTGIKYTFSTTDDGVLTPAAPTQSTTATYTCASDGDKHIKVTATNAAGATASKTVTVHCDGSACAPPVCGDHIKNGTEQCDDFPATARCQNCLIVPTCHDGVVDAPETCDTPANTATCVNCQTVVPVSCSSAWLTCIGTTTLANAENTSCPAGSACRNVQTCVLDSGCWSPDPQECYCGEGRDLDACEGSSFVPSGACVSQMKLGVGNANATNAEVLDGYFDNTLQLGKALLIIDNAVSKNNCVVACE